MTKVLEALLPGIAAFRLAKPGFDRRRKIKMRNHAHLVRFAVIGAFGGACTICGCHGRLRLVPAGPLARQYAVSSIAHASLAGLTPWARRAAFYTAIALAPDVVLACPKCCQILRLNRHLNALHDACCGSLPPTL